jgi:hypothetical protein
MVLWFGCSLDRNPGDSGAAGVAGSSDSSAGKAGGAASAGTSGGTAGSAGASATAGKGATAGQAGDGSGGSGNNGGDSNPSAGSGGEAGQGVAPSCEIEQTEPCGECGTRTCDPTTLTWGDCIGDGHQESCWETEAGDPLPGEMPTDPQGNCVVGQKTCDPMGQWQACLGAVAPESEDRCDEPGDDADCDGMVNDGCTCQENETRVCGIDTGNCQTGMQTCTNLMWGDCVGQITAQAQDSCAVAGDDANCNGVDNDRCMCTEDMPDVCADSYSCTTDSCQNGTCSNPINATYCLIAGSCVPHGQADPSNPCRRCDTAVSRAGWTNSPNNTSCDDSLWCNGTDTCNGSGTCTHQFTGNRCTGTGLCDSPTCDESRDSCFRPSSYTCRTTQQYECTSSSCGGDLQSRTVTQFCTGSASGCTGMTQTGGPALVNDCQSDTTCNASGQRCDPALGCGTTWCDNATNLCWMTTDAPTARLTNAATYCSTLNLGGRPVGSWRLPTINEWIDNARACDGTTGTAQAASFPSTCGIGPSTGEIFDCAGCPLNGGPAASSGCYWQAGMGTCAADDLGYWSSTPRVSGASENFYYTPRNGSIFFFNREAISLHVRCVTPRP